MLIDSNIYAAPTLGEPDSYYTIEKLSVSGNGEPDDDEWTIYNLKDSGVLTGACAMGFIPVSTEHFILFGDSNMTTNVSVVRVHGDELTIEKAEGCALS